MRTNILRIRFDLLGSVLFAVIAYAVSVNMEIGFFAPNWWWMSNNFALTVSGGIFTGFLVALLCEIREYEEQKQKAERDILFYSVKMYGLLRKIYYKAQSCRERQTEIVSSEMFDEYKKELKDTGEELLKIEKQMQWFHKKQNDERKIYLLQIGLIGAGILESFDVDFLLARVKKAVCNEQEINVKDIHSEMEKIEKNTVKTATIIGKYLKTVPDDRFSKEELTIVNKMRAVEL